MAKGIYIGVDGKARKVKRIYVGVNGKARDVRKVYVGNAAGKAEPVWSYMPIVRKGNGPSLRAGTCEAGATPVGNYAIIAGGRTNYVDSFSDTLVRQTLSSIRYSTAIDKSCATFENNKYAVFAGGDRSTSNRRYVSSYVYAYNEKLTQSSLSNLSIARDDCAGESVGDYVIFVGGSDLNVNLTNSADCYNSSLTKVSIARPGVLWDNATHGHTASHAIFFGGLNDTNTSACDRVVYDKNLTMKKTTTAIRLAMNGSRGASIDGKWVLFPVPSDIGDFGTYIKSFAYTDDLTEISIQPAKSCSPMNFYSSVSFGSYAIFAGGTSVLNGDTVWKTDVTSVYDSYLTCLDSDPVGDKNTNESSMSRIGTSNYCILVGGYVTGGDNLSRTDIFELIY